MPFLLVLISAVSSTDAASQLVSTADLDRHVEVARVRRRACGPICAWYCLKRLGYDVRLDRILEKASLTDKGIQLTELLALIRESEPAVSARALTGNPKNLVNLQVPSILIAQTHCVVYDGLDASGKYARIFEPVTGKVRQEPVANTVRAWKGEAITFEEPQLSPVAFWSIVLFVAVAVTVPGIWLVPRSTERFLDWRRRCRPIA